jgi:hypothetical protein
MDSGVSEFEVEMNLFLRADVEFDSHPVTCSLSPTLRSSQTIPSNRENDLRPIRIDDRNDEGIIGAVTHDMESVEGAGIASHGSNTDKQTGGIE